MESTSIFRGLPLLPILNIVSEPVVIAAPDPWRVVYANSAAMRWLTFPPDGGVHGRLETMLRDRAAPDLIQVIEPFWRSGDAGATLPTHVTIDGQLRPVTLHAYRLSGLGEPLLGMVIQAPVESSGDPVSIAAARRDPLTGLPDRAFLLSRLAELMHAPQPPDHKFAVLFVDLDNFKQVNDAQGHLIGDRVLREASRRLTNAVREGDHVVRFGGDEFVVLVEEVGEQTEVESIIRRIHAVLGQPIALPDGEVTLSVSIGAAEAAPEHRSPEDVLAAADRAMYASKRLNG